MSEKEIDVIEVLEPSAQIYTVVLAKDTENELVLTQKPLSFFGKIELFSVLGSAIEKALAQGSVISDFLEVPENKEGLGEADTFIKAISKIAQVAPDLVGDIFCISFGV